MQIISNVTELRERLDSEASVAFVPTMGSLHEGHFDLALIAQQ